VNKYFGPIAEIMKGLGISPPQQPEVTLDEMLEQDIDLDTIELPIFEAYLQDIASYNLYLKSQKGSYEAKLRILRSEYDRELGLQTRAGPQSSDGGGWLTKEEKEAAALAMQPDLAELRDKILVLDGVLTKIKDLPWAIDKKLDLLRLKLQRRVKEEA
jgi:hypothetical protein